MNKLIPCCVLLCCAVASAKDIRLASPDQTIQTVVTIQDGVLSYKLDFKGAPVVLLSKLGFVAQQDCTQGFTYLADQTRAVRQSWRNPFGERALVPDVYQETHIALACGKLKLILECRQYDAGFAFRYVFPKQETASLQFKSEETQFAFAGDYRTWPVYNAQGNYKPSVLTAVKPGAERPLVVELPNAVVALGEAALIDFARMKFHNPAKNTTLVSKLDGTAELTLPGATPWRYVRVAADICRLYDGNDLLLNLNEPCKLKDTSWIKPGKVIRETSLTTKGGLACVDFCKKMNMQYVEFDAGWYGHEYDDAADARDVHLDPKRSKGPLDLKAVIAYGKTNNIGVLLYVNRRELERRLDELLPIYASWGVAGIKYGFINVGPQKWTAWASDAIRKAGEAGFLVDIHDEYRLTGNQRTYPNVLTVEGVGGNEEMPDAVHNCALAFTRYLSGPADYTPCWYADRVKNTRAHQLALPAVYFSPFQFLFWYDRPQSYKGDPELDFWKQIPTVWDETRAINGRIGDYATIARRSGEQWFVGSINAGERRTLPISLSFLKPGVSYKAHIYRDGAPDGSNRTLVVCEEKTVTAKDTLSADMASNGGHAVRLEPLN